MMASSAERAAPVDAGSRSAEIVARMRDLEGAGMRSFLDDPPFVWERATRRADHQTPTAGSTSTSTRRSPWRRLATSTHAWLRRSAAKRSVLMHCSSAYPSPVRAEFYEALGVDRADRRDADAARDHRRDGQRDRTRDRPHPPSGRTGDRVRGRVLRAFRRHGWLRRQGPLP